MISNISELRKAKEVLDEVKQEFRASKIAFNEHIDVGIMVEVPSAALTADILAQEVQFFSIGSNDLIQYSLAVDRGNEKVAYLYQPTHPAILRLMKQIIDSGHAHKIWVGICGEMAANPTHAVLLLGLGIDEMSVSAVVLPKVKKIIRSVKREDAQRLLQECLDLHTSEEIQQHLDRSLSFVLNQLDEM